MVIILYYKVGVHLN